MTNKLNPKKIKDRIMQICHDTGAGHAASAMSCVNVLVDLYNNWDDEIIILSKGHGVLAQYVILNELGKLPDEVLDSYYKDGGLSGHATLMPEYGIYASTGSLGHGLGIGIGYAIANPNKKVAVVLGDGELQEGSTLEALRIMQDLKINNLLPIVDVNDWQGFKETRRGIVLFQYREYFSIKGEGFGDGIENTLSSHYAKVDNDILREWQENSAKIERARLDRIAEYEKKLKKQN